MQTCQNKLPEESTVNADRKREAGAEEEAGEKNEL